MKVNEIFYSLQGEGFFTGIPAVFLRFSGCNLKCSFCDTDHRSGKEMTDREILAAITAFPSRHIVITGGEPSLQLTADFIALLHATGYFIQIETNGTHTLPAGIDWVTCSPKFSEMPAAMADSLPLLHSGIINEIKLVFQSAKQADEDIRHIPALPEQLYLQPCDCGDTYKNRIIVEECIRYIKAHPLWKLSLQTHKLLSIR